MYGVHMYVVIDVYLCINILINIYIFHTHTYIYIYMFPYFDLQRS